METTRENVSFTSGPLRQRQTFSLASDANVLRCMQEMSLRIASRAGNLLADLDTLQRDTTKAAVEVENCIHSLNFTSTKQFMENRVYDDSEVPEKVEDGQHSAPAATQADFVPKVKEALGLSLPHIRLKSGLKGTCNGFPNAHSYSTRSLPYLMGSEEFVGGTVGPPTCQTLQPAVSPAPAKEAAPCVVSGAPSAQSSTDSTPVFRRQNNGEGFPSSASEASSMSSKASSVLAEQPKPLYAGQLRDELAARLNAPLGAPPASTGIVSFAEPAGPVNPPHVAKTAEIVPRSSVRPVQRKNLFDDSSSDDSEDGQLFKPAVPKSAANLFSSLDGAMGQAAAVNASAVQPAPSGASGAIENATKRRVPALFGSSDSEDDLFGNPVVTPKPTATKTPANPGLLREEKISATPGLSKPQLPSGGKDVSETPNSQSGPTAPVAGPMEKTMIRPGNLFGDSDSDEEDLFGGVGPKSNATATAKPSLPSPQPNSISPQPCRFQSTPLKAPPAENGVPSIQSAHANPSVAATQDDIPKRKILSLFADDSDDEDLFGGAVSRPAGKPNFSAEPRFNARPFDADPALFGDACSPPDVARRAPQPLPPNALVVDAASARSSIVEATKSIGTASSSEHINPPIASATSSSTPTTVASDVLDPIPVGSDSSLRQSGISPRLPVNEVPDGTNLNIPTNSMGEGSNRRKISALFDDDDDDEDLFGGFSCTVKSNPVVTAVGDAIQQQPVVMAPSVVDAVCQREPPPEKDTPTEKAAGLIASLKLSLAKQPNSLHFSSSNSASTTPSDETGVWPTPSAATSLRKPFGGVSLFGPAPIGFVKPELESAPPPTLDPVGQQTDSLECLGKLRPKAPGGRRLPSRSFRRSAVLRKDVDTQPEHDENVNEFDPVTSAASAPASPSVSSPTNQSFGETSGPSSSLIRSTKPLFDDSDSDDELFKPSAKVQSNGIAQMEKPQATQSTGILSNAKINSSLLGGAESDNSSLFASQTTAPSKRLLAATSLLLDSDDDGNMRRYLVSDATPDWRSVLRVSDLFSSAPKPNQSSKTQQQSTAAPGSEKRVVSVSDPLIGYDD